VEAGIVIEITDVNLTDALRIGIGMGFVFGMAIGFVLGFVTRRWCMK